MKKVILVLVTFVTMFTLSACGVGDEETLRVGMDLSYPPFETQDGGEPVGISVDVAKEFGEYLGRDVEIVDTDFGSLIPSLMSGEIDVIIASMSITEARAETVDFSDPYFYFKIISLLNAEFADENDIGPDTSTDDILAIEDARYVGLADQISYQVPRDLGLDVLEATDLPSAVFEITQGQRDILMMSAFPVVNNHRENEETTKVNYSPFQSSPIGMAVRPDDDELLEDANSFIAQMEEGGVYDRLRETWNDEINDRLGGSYDLDFFINED